MVLQLIFKPHPKILGGVAGSLMLVLGVLVYNCTQGRLDITLASQQSVQVNGPLHARLSQVVTGTKATITPKIDGTWKEEHSLLGVGSLTFVPKNRFEPGRSYVLHVSGMKRVITGESIPDVTETFKAQVPAAIKTTSPLAAGKDVSITPKLSVTLREPNRGVRLLRATLSPEVPLRQVAGDDQTFSWEPAEPLKQGTEYTLLIDDLRLSSPEARRLVSVPFTTVSEPAIVSARTGGSFARDQTVDIVFDQAMQASTDHIKFDVGGKGTWADDKTYRYKPEGLAPGKTYNYTVSAGTASKAGGKLMADHPYSFSTNAAVTAALSPGGRVSRNTAIRVAFDQAVDHASAEAHFATAPHLAGSFSWSANTMTYSPTGADYQTTYRYSIAAGVQPVWGLPGVALSQTYVTENEIIKLGVPAFKQAFGRSCELASLRMLLAFRGVATSDWDILQRIGYNPRPRDTASNSWDDPNRGFVGRVDTYSWAQGYGVHAGPVATAARGYGRNAIAQFNVSAAFISANIHAGNPVEFWGHISSPSPDSWNTPYGVVQTTSSMHARVVYGVEGRADAPVGFHVIDPWTGAKSYWSASQLMANMNSAPPASNQAVVVY